MTRRIMHIGRQAIALDRCSPASSAGRGDLDRLQAFINMGVNLALPTKGLTLPLMSLAGRRSGNVWWRWRWCCAKD